MGTGIAINTIIIIVIAAFVLLAALQLTFEKSDKNVGRAIIEVGSALVLSAVPSALEIYAGLFSAVLGVDVPILNSSEQFIWVCMALGVVLIVFGCVITARMKEPVYILNMVGQSKREINTDENERSLHIAGYKIKEQVVDIIPIFGNGDKIDKKTNGFIVQQIEDEVKRFSNRTEGKKSCFTGMAPIPYMVFAGTLLANANISRYFEYERHQSESYYELSKKNPRKKWLKLEEVGSVQESTEEEVVLAVGISHQILDDDLKIFGKKPVIRLEVSTPGDNLIRYKEQLLEYKNVVYQYIEEILKKRYKNLKTIHLVTAIPGCLSLEIGKAVGAGRNRVPQIAVYHYISSAERKYSFGLYVSGSSKGKLV